ncbi:MAG: threonine/serine dehydratase [Thalassobaculales bacterium]
MIGIDDISAARQRIAGHVRRTPVMALDHLKDPPPVAAAVTLKLECLQVTGSFKARGAMNRLLATPREALAGGIVTASGGNHGLAVARAAHAAGVPATIFLPANVSPAKLAKLKRWGAATVIAGAAFDEANAAALAHVEATGGLYVHPFADPLVVAGQGTLGLEILEDMADVDTILVAIGGGGLVAGLSAAVKARRPEVRVIGIEPEGSPTLKACLDAGRLVALEAVTTRVPTMACRQTTEAVFQAVRAGVDEIVLVSDDDMQRAAEWLWFETGIAADLSGAAAAAVLRAGHPVLAGAGRICALACGAGPEGVIGQQ